MTSSTVSTSDIEQGSENPPTSSSECSSSMYNGRYWMVFNAGMANGCCTAGFAWYYGLCSLGLLSLAAGIYASIEEDYFLLGPCGITASMCCLTASNCMICHSTATLGAVSQVFKSFLNRY